VSTDLGVLAHLGIFSSDAPLLLATAGSGDPVEQVAAAAELGFAGVFDNALLARDPDDQRRLGEALQRRGLVMGTCTLGGSGVLPVWTDAEADVIPAVRVAADALGRAGGSVLTVALTDDDGDPEVQITAAVGTLRRAAVEAERRGIQLGLEPVSRARVPSSLVTCVADARRIVDDVDHPALGLIADTCHIALEDDDVAGILRANAGLWRAVQVADVPGRVEPGAGRLPFRAIASALEEIGWTAPVEAEFTPARGGSDGEKAATAAVEHLFGRRQHG
jgi:hydroxypyruvate isomerase